MTSEDVMKFCEKGSHEYEERDVLKSVRAKDDMGSWYILFQCNLCPSRWVKDFKDL